MNGSGFIMLVLVEWCMSDCIGCVNVVFVWVGVWGGE